MPDKFDFEWTPEKIAQLTKFWMDDLETSFMAKFFGVSRHAVLGKANRLRLPLRGTPRSGNTLRAVKDPSPGRMPVHRTGTLSSDQVRYSKENCMFVMDAGNTRYCGQPALYHKSYCQEHHAICTRVVPKPDRSRRYTPIDLMAFG